jgi:hypothetical protein
MNPYGTVEVQLHIIELGFLIGFLPFALRNANYSKETASDLIGFHLRQFKKNNKI